MKKKFIYSLCIIMIMGLMVGCGKKEDSSGKTESNQEQVLSSEPKHENNYMRVLDSTYFKEEIQGKIVDVVNSGQYTYLLTSDNKVYRRILVDYDYFVTLDSNFNEIASSLMCDDYLIVENQDGTYTSYDFFNPETKRTFKANNAICAYGASLLTVISFENGILYYSYDDSSPDSITKQRIIVNEKKGFGLSEDSDYYTGTYASASPVGPEGLIMTTKSDGTLYFLGKSQGSKDDNYVMTVNWNYSSAANVDKTFITGSVGDYYRPFYTKTTDNVNLYVRDNSFTSPTEFVIALPTGYTKADIENVYASEEIILVMKDKKVFYKEDTSVETWESLDAISELIKNKNITKIVGTTSYILMLGDDGYLYRFD